ncbi:MAG: sulfotransferase [Chloroflexi bacterium]|nr:sulfotransferase [Chloroflexota bacterium]
MTNYEIRKTFRRANPRKIFYMFKWKISKKRPSMQFDDRRPCVFVLSTGRVGSETVSRLLSLAKNVLVYHEPWPELFALSKKAYEFSDVYPDDQRLADVLQEGFLTARRELLNYSLYCDHGYVEAGPPATFLAPLILKAIPEVKFIHLVRDPQSVVSSGMHRGWYSGHAYDSTRIVPAVDSEMGRLWDNMNPYQKNCWLWAETNDWIIRFSKTLPADKYLLIHAEDIFQADEVVIRQMFDYVGSPSPSTQRITGVLRQKLNAQTRGTFQQPDDWMADLNDSLRKFMNQTAGKLGYK